jgi:AbrB family transcriptional regulator (stage V sporulation protein T)
LKATGIVRRIDDLGRIVIPKEIRRTLHIREGDPLEIYTDRQGEVILKKYSPIGELGKFAQEYAESIFQTAKYIVCICDRDNIIAISGLPKKNLLNKKIGPQIEKVIENRRTVIGEKSTGSEYTLLVDEDEELFVCVISPIVAQGDPIGALILLSEDSNIKITDNEVKIAEIGSSFLGKQMEQ